jgi:hypothetical protein
VTRVYVVEASVKLDALCVEASCFVFRRLCVTSYTHLSHAHLDRASDNHDRPTPILASFAFIGACAYSAPQTSSRAGSTQLRPGRRLAPPSPFRCFPMLEKRGQEQCC